MASPATQVIRVELELLAVEAVEGEPARSLAASRAFAPAQPEHGGAVDPARVLVRPRDPGAGALHLLLVDTVIRTVGLEDPAARPREAEGAALVQQGRTRRSFTAGWEGSMRTGWNGIQLSGTVVARR